MPPPPVAVFGVFTVTFIVAKPPFEFHTVTVFGAEGRMIEPLKDPSSNCIVPSGPTDTSVP